MRTSTILAACLGVTLAAADSMAEDVERGAQHHVVCAACHGGQGEGSKELNAPRIAGLNDWYLVRQLLNYKEGSRGADPDDELGGQMRTMAMTLADEQAVVDVVAYIETLEPEEPEHTVTGDVAMGESRYTLCSACHGVNGEGNVAANAPRLAGQSDWYLVRQLKAFKEGVRGTHDGDIFGAQMRPMALLLADDAAINNVVAYINSLEASE